MAADEERRRKQEDDADQQMQDGIDAEAEIEARWEDDQRHIQWEDD